MAIFLRVGEARPSAQGSKARKPWNHCIFSLVCESGFDRRPVIYAGSADRPRIEAETGTEIAFAPEAAQGRFRCSQEQRKEGMRS